MIDEAAMRNKCKETVGGQRCIKAWVLQKLICHLESYKLLWFKVPSSIHTIHKYLDP